MDPDELYTLRAQYWMGHYQLAIEEARAIARRPMNPALKAEREEFLARCYLALGQYDKVTSTDTPALKALSLKAQYEAAVGNEDAQESILDQLRSLLGGEPIPGVQLAASQVLLSAGHTKEALGAVHLGSTMEHIAMVLQIYLKLDRLDLAQNQLETLKQTDEDAVLTQLGSVFVNLTIGKTGAADAIHALNSLTEQYGASPLLLNLMAAAQMQQNDYSAAEQTLQECLREHGDVPCADTLVNIICAQVHQNKSPQEFVQKMQMEHPHHAFCAGLERVTQAFDREAIKYKV